MIDVPGEATANYGGSEEDLYGAAPSERPVAPSYMGGPTDSLPNSSVNRIGNDMSFGPQSSSSSGSGGGVGSDVHTASNLVKGGKSLYSAANRIGGMLSKDATEDTAIEAAGGGPEDPVADAVAIGVDLYNAYNAFK